MRLRRHAGARVLRAVRSVTDDGIVRRPAEPRDTDAVRRLLAAAGLPADLPSDWFPGNAIVALRGVAVVGAAAFERAGEHALLRSVVVREAERGKGLARALVDDRLGALRASGCTGVYLLTTDAGDYFARLGFVAVPRDGAPAPLRALSQFSTLCPASATCMRLA